MLSLPESTEINKIIPKEKFYQKANINSQLKKEFVNNIEKIIWTNSISSKTLNIKEEEQEIQFFNIKLKNVNLDNKVLEVIDKAIPYFIVFILEYEGRYKLYISYKENNVIIKTFNTCWLSDIKLTIDGNKIENIFRNFINQISLDNFNGEKQLSEEIINNIEQEKIIKQIKVLENKTKNEKQLDKKFEITQEIKRLKSLLK